MSEQRAAIIEWVNPALLKAHPRNTEIYGDDGYQDLIESVATLGVMQAIYINPHRIIISGHRRWNAAMAARLSLVPTITVKFNSELDERQAIIEHNRYRIKNGLQLYNESRELKELEAERAKGRQRLGKENFPYPEELGQARDKVAEAIGLGSGRQLDKLEYIAEVRPGLLNDIKPGGITIHKAVKLIQRDERLSKRRNRVPIPDGNYDIIYADPPWHYRNDGFSGGADAQYPTMSFEQLRDIKLPAADDCVLFLWSTNPHLEDALYLLKAWGFSYKTNFVWDKGTPRIGFYNMNQHEILIVATKGSSLEPWGEKASSVITAARSGHSAKPLEAYTIVEEMYPNVRRIELFARNRRDGWDSWGDEID